MKFNNLFFTGLLFLGISTVSISAEDTKEISTNTDEYYVLKEKHLKELLEKVDFSAIDLETNYSVNFKEKIPLYYFANKGNAKIRCTVDSEMSIHVIFVKSLVYVISNTKELSDGKVQDEACNEELAPESAEVNVFKKPVKSSLKRTILGIQLDGKIAAQNYPESSTKEKNTFIREGNKLNIFSDIYGDSIYEYNQRPLNMHDLEIDNEGPEQFIDILDIPDSLLERKNVNVYTYNAPFVGWSGRKMIGVRKLSAKIDTLEGTLKEYLEKVAGPQICK